jgi:hypothetical protein
MLLLLTVLSGIALLALLAVLLVGLVRVQYALDGINASLSKIAMGVRAIESETGILKAEAPTTLAAMTALADGGELIAARLSSADARLAGIAEALGAGGAPGPASA